VLWFSVPAASFSELTVSVDAARGDDVAVELQASQVPARCCTHSTIAVDISSDAELVHLHAEDEFTARPSVQAMPAYVCIPECEAVAGVLTSCWAGRQSASFGILLHGPPGSGKTACINHGLCERTISHSHFDCALMYERDGALFKEAVQSVARQSKRSPVSTAGCGAVLVLDHLECMFPPMSLHAQVRIL
jgi:hypothetical protein